jgi:multiple sugar transport system permease protein
MSEWVADAAPGADRLRRRAAGLGLSKRGEGVLLLAPLVLFLILLLGFPFLANLYCSLSKVTFATIRAPQWLGLQNYAAALTDPAFWQAMGFSLRFALIATGAEVLLGLLLALALEPLIARRKFLLAFLLLPMMISPALMGVMYRLNLNEFVGLIPQYLALLRLYPNLLGPEWVMTTVVTIEILQWTPFAFLIMLTALQAIPGELLEAARIDGGSWWQRHRYVLLPLLAPALVVTGFIRFIDSFRVFDHIYVLTGGGPGTLTTSVSIHIYKSFFQQELLGQAGAASMILLALSMALLWLAMRFVLRGAHS